MNTTLFLQQLTAVFSGQSICPQDRERLSALFEAAGLTLADCLISESLCSVYFTTGIDDLPGMVRFLYDRMTEELIPREVITIPADYEDVNDPDDFYRHFVAQSFVWGIQPLQDNWSGHMLAGGSVVLIGGNYDDCQNWYCAKVQDKRVGRVTTVPGSLLLQHPQHIFGIAAAVVLLREVSDTVSPLSAQTI